MESAVFVAGVPLQGPGVNAFEHFRLQGPQVLPVVVSFPFHALLLFQRHADPPLHRLLHRFALPETIGPASGVAVVRVETADGLAKPAERAAAGLFFSASAAFEPFGMGRVDAPPGRPFPPAHACGGAKDRWVCERAW